MRIANKPLNGTTLFIFSCQLYLCCCHVASACFFSFFFGDASPIRYRHQAGYPSKFLRSLHLAAGRLVHLRGSPQLRVVY